jgi:hypothetical protein
LFISFQYGGFLLVIFLLEISAGVSVYVYRERLLEGFDKGLGQSIATYTTDPKKASDFDLMQSTVSVRHYTLGAFSFRGALLKCKASVQAMQ